MKPMELIEQGRFLGSEFLLWLWMRGLSREGSSGVEGDGSACFLDDAIQFVGDQGDVKQVSLKKGNPAESIEAFEGLRRGMQPASAKFRILAGDLEWVFTLNAATLEVSSLKMPKSSSKDPQGILQDRLFLLEELFGHLGRRYASFIQTRLEVPDGLKAELDQWITDGLAVALAA